MSGDFNSRNESHSTKFEQRPEILLKLSSRYLRDPNLSGLSPFDNMAISMSKKEVKIGKVGYEFMRHRFLKQFCHPH